MHYRSLVSPSSLIGAGLVLCGQAHAADDSKAACDATNNAYLAAVPSGDPAKMAAVYAPEGEYVTPWGVVAGRDALIKFYASFIKPGDKQTDTLTSLRMIGDVALCTGSFTFSPASGEAASKGNWTKVAGKVGGEWKILNLTYNFAAPQ
jgi:uncharacterized protein (TIGR02246 family)